MRAPRRAFPQPAGQGGGPLESLELHRDPGPSADPRRHFVPQALGGLTGATEGVSHFLYLVFRAENDTTVSQLELELQAEVDKYASAVLGERGLSGNGVMTIQARTRGVPGGRELARSRAVRAQLFAGVRFLDGPDSPEGRRYRMAHRLAARYTAKLERRHLDHGDVPAFLHELRRFYRHGLREKLEAVR